MTSIPSNNNSKYSETIKQKHNLVVRFRTWNKYYMFWPTVRYSIIYIVLLQYYIGLTKTNKFNNTIQYSTIYDSTQSHNTVLNHTHYTVLYNITLLQHTAVPTA